jgi:uncharacterized protein YjeT (DUF2065 family)
MRRLSAIEKAGAALGLLVLVLGGVAAVFPKEGVISHPSEYFRQPWVARSTAEEHISKDQARVYGILAATVGAGILWFSVYRTDK